ncbi:MAG: tRNA (adenosine(37)-N6)-dimethylallyltransferase MiaA [Bacteroidetes bacterium]|nr:tRNA (adenosine(37)-N6)-dimethylallyltransferase MiaA [Bacteroidota bacterium]
MEIEVITGPTASGKTALAIERARSEPRIEIVNADASLLYRGFDIGTAKPSPHEQRSVAHHLIDILDPDESFSAADFQIQARNAISDILSRRKIPVVVGGTGFYIDALFDGLSVTEVDPVRLADARRSYEAQLEEKGFDTLLAELEPIDPTLFAQIARELNPRRLQRAWEYYLATGTPLGKARSEKPEPFEHRPKFTVLQIERDELRRRIEQRVDGMLGAGWLAEVKKLIEHGVRPEMPAMKAIGYRSLVEVLHGTKTLEVVRDEIIVQTRQYAKRQVTWMKRYVRS